jgi:hypothetical protein
MATTVIAAMRRFHFQLRAGRFPLANDRVRLARTLARHHRHSPSSLRSSGAPQLPQMSTVPVLTNACYGGPQTCRIAVPAGLITARDRAGRRDDRHAGQVRDVLVDPADPRQDVFMR